ncbi:peroxidase 29 [Selaginella moellendorffii]|nr:peroxidase 29 [Selaginella moellendorffii]|eukprot:XP_002976455.2 peroxidase 29 [Selaginella moellendorffii]
MDLWLSAFWFWLTLSGLLSGTMSQLRAGFYDLTCPRVESIVRTTMTPNLMADPTAAAALVRAAFHDCQVGGCDASILLTSAGAITSEQESDKNFGIRGLNVIDRVKTALEFWCPGVVSCADIVVLAARDAITMGGGPTIDVLLGRRDSRFASNAQADSSLPPATITVPAMLDMFKAKGITPEEGVALIGAHTIGVSHCVSFVNRLYPSRDSAMGLVYAGRLGLSCPTGNPVLINNLTVVANDNTNLIFDNQYFRDVSSGMGLLTIDAELGVHPATSGIVALYAQNQKAFFDAFTAGFLKLTSHTVLTGDSGEIRRSCGSLN